nr:isochorismatase family protein [uncultured Roseateles sp.]
MATLPSGRIGLGRRPALIIVDATVGFTDPASPLGSDSIRELAVIGRLLAGFRSRGLPVVYTVNAYRHPAEASVFREKIPLLNLLVADTPIAAIAEVIAPQAGEIVIRKGVPSAFFDSPLRQLLVAQDVDSVLVCGFTTSGCVRATAVDALQSNFRLLVARDACGDRDAQAHEANLRDLNLKYGDVVMADEALAMLPALS